MRMCLIALTLSCALSACATTQQASQSSDEECSLVDQDATGTKITKKQECNDSSGSQGAAAPQR